MTDVQELEAKLLLCANDQDKVDILLALAKAHINTNLTQGNLHLQHAYQLAIKINYRKGIAWSLLRMGSYALRDPDYEKALDLYYHSQQLMITIDDKQGQSRNMFSIGTTFIYMNNYKLALEYLQQALVLSFEYDSDYYYTIINNLINVHSELGHVDEAYDMAIQMLGHIKEHSPENLYYAYSTVAEICIEKKDYITALDYAEKSLDKLKDRDIPYFLAICNVVIANAYKGLGHYDQSFLIYKRALEYSIRGNDPQLEIGTNILISKLLLGQDGRIDESFPYLQKALTLSKKHVLKKKLSECYHILALYHEKKKTYDEALRFQKLSTKYRDDVFSEEVKNQYKAAMIELQKNELQNYSQTPTQEITLLNQAEHMSQIKDALKNTMNELENTYEKLLQSEKLAALGSLTDSFVETLVETLDIRDTTTAGHSKRLANYCLALCDAVHTDDEYFPDEFFDDYRKKALYYGALLHDIGKIGVPESILLKANRLSEERLMAIEYRFLYIKTCIEYHSKDMESQEIINQLDNDFLFIKKLSTQFYASDMDINRIMDIASKEILDCKGVVYPLLLQDEVNNLIIRKGNLNNEEWILMKNHANLTYDFLKKIPWLESLAIVPEISGSHHEKMDGSGYHRGLKGDEIVLEARILAVCDIFEALTSKDRPYKKEKSTETALSILRQEADAKHLDSRLVSLFEKHQVFNHVES